MAAKVGDFWELVALASVALKLQTKVCDCSLVAEGLPNTMPSMANPSPDTQGFSGFASLHRADLTHEPQKAQEHVIQWGRIALIAIASVAGAVVLRFLSAW